MKKLLASLLLLLPIFVRAEDSSPYKSEVIGGQWLGLNNADASLQIADNEAQDLLNVDITDNGYGIRKRSGYAQFLTVGLSTHGDRGSHYFRDASGNDTLVFCNERDCSESVNSGAFSAFITTDTSGSYYDWTDANGSAWRATNNRDEICSYDGTALTYYPSLPKGDQIEFMPDRGAISGTSANPNRITYSKKTDFTNYTVGNEDGDPWTDDIGLPGSVVTAMKYALGRMFVWTRTSTIYGYGTNQFDWEYKDLSTTIGCTQPNSAVSDQGVVYWQGQDKHFYATDGEQIKKISSKLDVSGIVSLSGGSRFWEQTTQSDWEAGTEDDGLTVTASPGDIQFSTSGALHDNFSDGDFTSAPTWNLTLSSVPASVTISGGEMDFSVVNGSATNTTATFYGSTFPTAQSGFVELKYTPVDNTSSAGVMARVVLSTNAATVAPSGIGFNMVFGAASQDVATYKNGLRGTSLSSYSQTFTAGTQYKIKFHIQQDGSITLYVDDTSIVSTSTDAISGSTIKSVHIGIGSGIGGGSDTWEVKFDDIRVSTGKASFLSQSFNIGTVPSSWGTLNVTNVLNDGAISYAIYGDTNTSLTPSDPATYISSQVITSGSIPTITLSSYVAVGSTFTRTASTQNPTLNSFDLSWFEGTTVRHFGSVDKDHRVQWSVIETSGSVPNKTYIYDPRFDTWLKYDVPFDAAVTVGDTLYFGGVSTGVVYQYPSGNTDAGSAITAYWKSKDFIAGNLFSEKVYKSISIVPKRQTGSNLDITYTVNTSSANAYNISLTDADGNLFVRNNYWLPTGKRGSFLNIKFGNDDGDAPFEVYVLKYEYEPLPWRKLP